MVIFDKAFYFILKTQSTPANSEGAGIGNDELLTGHTSADLYVRRRWSHRFFLV